MSIETGYPENASLDNTAPSEMSLEMEVAELREELARVRNELGHAATKFGSFEILISEGGREEENIKDTEATAAEAEAEMFRLIARKTELTRELQALEIKERKGELEQPPFRMAA